MNIPTFVMMIGLVGSGKTVKAHELAEQYNATVFSSDALRKELFGDINEQSKNQELFTELHGRIKNCLKNGKSAIMDCTNINYKKRMAFLSELKNISCEKVAVLMAIPYEKCLKRNSERERKVPEDVIKRMYMNFQCPWYHEGWNRIDVIYDNYAEDCKGLAREWVESVRDFNQENSHHALSLGDHCWETVKYIDNNISMCHPTYTELRYAAMLHDEAKIFTKSFFDGKGQPSKEAHYYFHQYCGAYDSLFYEMDCNHLYVAQLIQFHMHPYMSWMQSEKSKKRDRKNLGGQLFEDIMLLHKADEAAH